MEKQAGQNGQGDSQAAQAAQTAQIPMTHAAVLAKRYRENVALLVKKRQILTAVSNELTAARIDIEAARSGSQKLSSLISREGRSSDKKDKERADKLHVRLRGEQDKIRDLGASISRLDGQLVEISIDIELVEAYVAALTTLSEEENQGKGSETEGSKSEAGGEAVSEDSTWVNQLPALWPQAEAGSMVGVEIEDSEDEEEPEIRID